MNLIFCDNGHNSFRQRCVRGDTHCSRDLRNADLYAGCGSLFRPLRKHPSFSNHFHTPPIILFLDLETRVETQLLNAGIHFPLFLSRVCDRPSAEAEENDSYKS